jgi:hypothetical protein
LLGQYMWYDKIIVLLYCCESILRASHDWLGMIICESFDWLVGIM